MIEQPAWKGFTYNRLPAHEIPAEFRDLDARLRYVAVSQLAAADGNSAVHLGPNVISFHRKAPYGSWATFRPQVECTLESLFKIAEKVSVNRIGIRYLNALTPVHDNIRSIADLNLRLAIADQPITEHVVLNFGSKPNNQTRSLVKIATRDFVQGSIPGDTSVYIDVDVFTNDEYVATDKDAVGAWVDAAHVTEKLAFFSLLTREQIDRLKAE